LLSSSCTSQNNYNGQRPYCLNPINVYYYVKMNNVYLHSSFEKYRFFFW
jgi:hypothetical protein